MERTRFSISEQREQSRRAANNLFSDRKDRVVVSKAEAEAKSAASDANTARLRALRLNKEQANAQANGPKPAPSRGSDKR
jgi:streptogramin lyase